jgi:phosphoglucosamine mutase
MSHYFGTDGFRGEAGGTLTASHAYRIGRFLGHYYKTEGGRRVRIAVGKDTRRSSYMLEYALASGLVASGADAYMLHVTTTPSVAFITRSDGMDCGVMISASHNPFQDNGIKLVNRLGEKMEDEVLHAIEDYLDTPDRKDFAIRCATGEDIGRIVDYSEGRNRYVAYLISLAKNSYRGFRIGLDCANGAAWRIAESVFCALGARVMTIGCEPDGLNINQGVGSTHIERLLALVKSNHLDAGFAFDGDADRCLAVDELGGVLTGDHILYALSDEWKKRGLLTGNTVVTTVMSNMGLYRALDERGIAYVQTAVGDKYVYDAMNKGGFSVGGESSGHIILRPYAQTGDGILTAIQLMELTVGRKMPLSRAAGELRMFPQRQYNVRVSSKTAALHSPAVQQAVKQAKEALGEGGRILLRESGTEPVIRLMVEAEDEALCTKTATALRDLMLSQGF